MCIDINKLYQKWEEQDWLFLQQYQGVIVACSGGIDSTALFHIFYNFIKNKKNYFLGITHVNFKLRGQESDEDQKFVENLSKKNCVPLKLLIVGEEHKKLKKGLSTQEWARLIRYNFFYDIAKEGYVIALAHNLDDLAENVILRLARGSQFLRSAGMQEWSPPFWRPLLNISRAQIQEYVKVNNIAYREDSSNVKLDYSRNIIRHKILVELEKIYPKAKEKIAQAAQDYQKISEFLEFTIKNTYIRDDNKIEINVIKDFNNIIIAEILRVLFAIYNIPQTKISRNLLLDLATRIKNTVRDWQYSLPDNKIFMVQNNLIFINQKNQNQKIIRFLQHKKNLFRKNIFVLLNKGSKCIVQIDNKNYECGCVLSLNKEEILGDNNYLIFKFEDNKFQVCNLNITKKDKE